MKSIVLIVAGTYSVFILSWIGFTLHESKDIGRYQFTTNDNRNMIIDSKTGALYIVLDSDFDKKFGLKAFEFSSAPK